MALAMALPEPSFSTPTILLSAVETTKLFEVVAVPPIFVVHALGQPETTTSTGLGGDQLGAVGGPEKPPPVPFGIAGPMPMPQLPFVCGIGMVVSVELVSADAPGVIVLTTNCPGPPANTSTVSVDEKVAAEAERFTVKLIAAPVVVRAKSRFRSEVEVAWSGVGIVLPKN